MNTDPTHNAVAFRLRSGDGNRVVVTQVPTRADDGIAQAWEAVRRQYDADPTDVSELECEWEPSERDQRFVARTFHGCPVRYHFARPADPDQWDAAFAAARRTVQEAMEEHLGETATFDGGGRRLG